MDIIEQASEVAGNAAQTAKHLHRSHETDRRVRRAQTAPFSRTDLGCWMAVVSGLDAKYGLARTFLPKAFPVAWQKRPEPAFDCTNLAAGQIIQMHGYVSRSTQEDKFYRVVANDDERLTLTEMTVSEVLTQFRTQE